MKWLMAVLGIMAAWFLTIVVNNLMFLGNPITAFFLGVIFGIFALVVWMEVYEDEL